MGSSQTVYVQGNHEEIQKVSCYPASYFNRDLGSHPVIDMNAVGLKINVGIDDSLLKYSGTNSNAVLNDYSSQLLTELGDSAPAFVENVGSLLAGVSSAPHAVGMGAFFIGMILKICFLAAKESNKTPDTGDLLRNVFAEEKSTGVRAMMDEYMKRYKMHLHNDRLLLEETTRLEKELSTKLTLLKDSMLNNGQMNDLALKYWTNGAAFHAQMLIHRARLQKKRHSSEFESFKTISRSTINIYNMELHALLKKYTKYKTKEYVDSKNLILTEYIYLCCALKKCCQSKCDPQNDSAAESDKMLDGFMEYIYSANDQIIKLKNYFPDLLTNLDTLTNQEGTFKIPG